MKVIQQLIAYFESKGKLTQRQVRQLVAKGYTGQYTAADLRSLEQKIGHSYFFQVSADPRGPLWGTDVYTSDSNLGTACLHAGVLKQGESGIVKVTIVQPIPIFQGTTRHGIVSRDWTTGWSGAFQVEEFAR